MLPVLLSNDIIIYDYEKMSTDFKKILSADIC